MTDLIKALHERREELRNELQEHPAFQEYELVCRLLERREASVSIPSSPRPKAPLRKPASLRKPAPPQQPVDPPAPFTRTDRGMNAVIEASADFLRRKGARADFGRDPGGVGPVRYPRRRSARSVEDHFVPRPRQGYVRQRPWRRVRVEGVADAVRLNQRRPRAGGVDEWRSSRYREPLPACRALLSGYERCQQRSSAPCKRRRLRRAPKNSNGPGLGFNEEIGFARDSPLEEAGFEPLVPLTLNARCLTLNLNRVHR